MFSGAGGNAQWSGALVALPEERVGFLVPSQWLLTVYLQVQGI